MKNGNKNQFNLVLKCFMFTYFRLFDRKQKIFMKLYTNIHIKMDVYNVIKLIFSIYFLIGDIIKPNHATLCWPCLKTLSFYCNKWKYISKRTTILKKNIEPSFMTHTYILNVLFSFCFYIKILNRRNLTCWNV